MKKTTLDSNTIESIIYIGRMAMVVSSVDSADRNAPGIPFFGRDERANNYVGPAIGTMR